MDSSPKIDQGLRPRPSRLNRLSDRGKTLPTLDVPELELVMLLESESSSFEMGSDPCNTFFSTGPEVFDDTTVAALLVDRSNSDSPIAPDDGSLAWC